MHLAIDRDERIDWFRIIIDLERSGYTLASIAVCVGVGKSTVSGWKSGATPKYDDGDLLLMLWCSVTKNGRESVHRVKRYSYRA